MKKYLKALKTFEGISMTAVLVMEFAAVCCGAFHHLFFLVGIAALLAVYLWQEGNTVK